MEVNLISYTENAVDILIKTKSTRLNSEDVSYISEEKKLEELDYMLKTIQSSWEFVDYIFEIKNVSRAFTHQLVRTRTGSYAQQSQRTVQLQDIKCIKPTKFGSEISEKIYHSALCSAYVHYDMLIEVDTPPQDARGILPTNTSTNIIAKFNLRSLSDLMKKRLCTRTQMEYQEVARGMRRAVLEVHPWADKFLQVYCASVGVCQFPNYKECPIKPDIFNPDTGKAWKQSVDYEIPENAIFCCQEGAEPANKAEIERAFNKMRFEATPKWKGNS